jgi:hypothetical protein
MKKKYITSDKTLLGSRALLHQVLKSLTPKNLRKALVKNRNTPVFAAFAKLKKKCPQELVNIEYTWCRWENVTVSSLLGCTTDSSCSDCCCCCCG